ncbi:DUF2771 family protein [Haloechinothrix salitolerans]|uniref:DUF2771 family protein n=1 Tax=Haloechinothrix salitolerans TaxID=926830 RepID=A0ABW2BVB3_9PSEU
MSARKTALGVLLGALALITTSCADAGPPEVSIYADGEHTRVAPLKYCDVLINDCDATPDARATLPIRPGEPVQISVPAEIAETPWLVNVQGLSADGTPLPVRQEFFAPGESHAYTARPANPGERLLVVEVLQLGGAYAGGTDGKPITDAEGNPQLLARGWWSLQLEAR